MSEKIKNLWGRKLFLWALLTFGSVIIIAMLFLFVNRAGGFGGGTPSIAVDQQKIDFGYQKLGTHLTFVFKVTNTGKSSLQFKEKPYVEVVKGCCPPELTIDTMMLKPGESTTVESSSFMMHPGMDGMHNYAVHLKTNDPKNPDLVVTVLSDWGP